VIEKIKNLLIKCAILLFPLLTTSCHYEFTSPLLFNHGSSSAYETCVFLWIVNISALVAAAYTIAYIQEIDSGSKNDNAIKS
jgi:hypothetical protein